MADDKKVHKGFHPPGYDPQDCPVCAAGYGAILIKASGEVIPTHPRNGKKFTLQELQSYVGGYIQLVDLPDGRYMVVNEDGKVIGLPTNQRATIETQLQHHIVGDVVICKRSMVR